MKAAKKSVVPVIEIPKAGIDPSHIRTKEHVAERFQIVPRLLRIPEAAHYIGGTNWCVEELVRAKRIPFIVVGKYRVIDVRDLDAWIDAEKKAQFARAVAA